MRKLFLAMLVAGAALFIDGFANDFRMSREIGYQARDFAYAVDGAARRMLRGFQQH